MATPNTKAQTKPNESIELAKCGETLNLLGMAIEIQRGAMSETKRVVADGLAVVWLNVTLGEKAPTTKAVIVNGELFVSALDAGAAQTRERSRLLAVARRAGNG